MKKVCVALAGMMLLALGVPGSRAQSLLPAGLTGLSAGDPASDAPDAQLYADGMRAIHEGRWSDAIKTFDRVIAQKADHAAGAFYWKAYALNKEGQASKALETCSALRTQFATSSWKEDCGALEVEIRSANGQPVQPKPGESEDVKLLALAKLMQRDPKKGKAELEAVLASDVSERMREGALYILGQNEPEASFPQVVRISYLEGDVRIARGGENRIEKNAWDAAVMNLPIEVGDSLATGSDGRLELEFEDASTVYLAPNSVLTFNDLHSTSGVPHSDIELVSGTLTMHLDSLVPGETFVLRTPTNDVLTRYPQRANMRVSSYADAIAIAPLSKGVIKLAAGTQPALPGQVLVFGPDHHLQTTPAQHAGDFSSWDAWVADRHAARENAEKTVMQEAHLSIPLPGLAELKDKGHFFSCPPYGTCWQPDAPQAHAQLVTGPAAPTPDRPRAQRPANAAGAPIAVAYVPCVSGALFNYYPLTVQRARWQFDPGYLFNPYDWAVCHSGSWIYQDNGYAWVVGRKIHHRPPIHWVRFGHTTAFVPIHPRDTKGQPPLNREHAFAPSHEKGEIGVAPIRLESGQPLNTLKSPPREFGSGLRPVLTGVQPPQMAMRILNSTSKPSIPMRLDPSRGFLATTHDGGLGIRNSMVLAPVARPAGGGSFASGSSSSGITSTARSGGMSGSSGSSVSSSSISVSSTSVTSTAVSSGGPVAAH